MKFWRESEKGIFINIMVMQNIMKVYKYAIFTSVSWI